jgi:hypothetical protein
MALMPSPGPPRVPQALQGERLSASLLTLERGPGTRSRMRSFSDGLRGALAQGGRARHRGRAKSTGEPAHTPPPAFRQLLLRPSSFCRMHGRNAPRSGVQRVLRARVAPARLHDELAHALGAAPRPPAAARQSASHQRDQGHRRKTRSCCSTSFPPSPRQVMLFTSPDPDRGGLVDGGQTVHRVSVALR